MGAPQQLIAGLTYGATNYPTVSATSTGQEDSASTSWTINLPAGIAAGNLIVIDLSCRNGRTITTPTGYTQLFKAGEGSGAITKACYYKTAAGGETTATLPVAIGAPGAWTCYRISTWRGTPEGSINAGGADPPSVTASWGSDKNLVIATGGNIDGGSTMGTLPSGFGNGLEDADSSNTVSASARLETTNATTNPTAWGTAGASSYAGTLVIRGL